MVAGLGLSTRYMKPTIERLSRHARVYAPDLPGFGKSERTRRALNVRELTDALVAWMQTEKLECAAFVGNSFGCQIIVDLAARYPQRVGRGVLIAPTVDASARSAWIQFARLLLNAPRERLTLIPIVVWDYLTAGIWRGIKSLRHAIDDPVEEKLPSVAQPMMVICGGRDPMVPEAWAQRVASLLPRGTYVVLPRAAHAINYSAPDELMLLIKPFLCDGKEVQ